MPTPPPDHDDELRSILEGVLRAIQPPADVDAAFAEHVAAQIRDVLQYAADHESEWPRAIPDATSVTRTE